MKATIDHARGVLGTVMVCFLFAMIVLGCVSGIVTLVVTALWGVKDLTLALLTMGGAPW
ncbi:MAG TPA: hypothetical protein VK509_16115 [Polyangiales bacterium]|nr:hypothetical protein [Polyangiales bacterium]